ncbi:MAG: DUF4149 domain-containing protein [Alphaproteobacteria bacterium]|jgi:hypothetical protein|nr:DUF4149 domain-containing protein [Alphaproteobacteria bacterium]
MIEYLNFHTAAAFLTALVVGGMAFFSFAVAPIVFRSLDRAAAGALMARIFPVYYRVMAAASLVAAFLVFYRAEALWLGLLGFSFILIDLLLRPTIDRLRPARLAGDEAASRAFGRLHGFSAVLNLAQWLGAIVLFFHLAA